jgi:ribulose-phosphate 3-epimerase
VAEIKQLLIEKGLQNKVQIEVDGGIKLHNAKEVIDAGADILVAGSEVFKADDPIQVMKSFYSLENL